MKKVTFSQISAFLENPVIAVAGASRQEKSFGVEVVNHLKSLNYKVICINPAYEMNFPEDNRYQSLEDVPGNNFSLLIATPKTETEKVLKSAIDKKVNNVWIQQMSETPEALALGEASDINFIYKECIFMFSKPEGIHKFHYTIKKIFRKIPR